MFGGTARDSRGREPRGATNKFSSQQFFSCLIRTFDGVNANDVTIKATVIHYYRRWARRIIIDDAHA
jgi:hypothetical protein